MTYLIELSLFELESWVCIYNFDLSRRVSLIEPLSYLIHHVKELIAFLFSEEVKEVGFLLPGKQLASLLHQQKPSLEDLLKVPIVPHLVSLLYYLIDLYQNQLITNHSLLPS